MVHFTGVTEDSNLTDKKEDLKILTEERQSWKKNTMNPADRILNLPRMIVGIQNPTVFNQVEVQS